MVERNSDFGYPIVDDEEVEAQDAPKLIRVRTTDGKGWVLKATREEA